MNGQTVQIKVNMRDMEGLASKIANEVSNVMYYELMLARYVPEIQKIQKRELKALSGKNARKYLEGKVSSLE